MTKRESDTPELFPMDDAPAAAAPEEVKPQEAAAEEAEAAGEGPKSLLPEALQGDLPPKGGDAEELTLAHYAARAYLEYALSVVKSRALPDVVDGMKPVQRRILYAMQRLHLTAADRYSKSARVVGDVIGKYHPHGDQAAYDAMVRMAQPFSMRYPLVDGKGNFGSRDGDGPAAMRYTEARLQKLAGLLLDEIDSDDVDFIANYDGTLEEPTVLPAKLPLILLNGASGIAVGMATEIPPHNLKEVAQAVLLLLEKPQATLDDILAVLPAPDFPGGAQIISSPAEIRAAYDAGRGSFKVRAKWRHLPKENIIEIYEIPYTTTSEAIIDKVAELIKADGKREKLTLTMPGLSQDDRNIILAGCLMNYYADQNK